MLDERQVKAIESLAKGSTITDAAIHSGVSRNTIYAWKELEEFTAELGKRQQEFISTAQARLKCAAKDAADEVIKLLKNGRYEKTRLSAAQDILDRNLGKATTRVEVGDNRDNKDNVTTDVLDEELNEFDNE